MPVGYDYMDEDHVTKGRLATGPAKVVLQYGPTQHVRQQRQSHTQSRTQLTFAYNWLEDVTESVVEAIFLWREEIGEECRASETVQDQADRLADVYSVSVWDMILMC